MLLVLFLGLLVLCGFCFGVGYAVGRRGTETAPVTAQSDTAAAQPNGSSSKPSALAEVPQAPPADTADSDQAAAEEPAGTGPAAVAQTLPVAAAQAASDPAAAGPTQTPVRPAIGSAAPGSTTPQPPAAATTAAQPAAGTVMVQIAAVSNAEDADVLTNALRKRGYAVTERRDPADNMIHIRIGPFATAAEANGWKMKLLNDGYNAEVQP
jgi:cell division septation protein DedD